MVKTMTQKMLLYTQLQEGLKHTLMQSPGAHDYSELCVAVRNEKLAKRPLNVGNHLSHSSSNPSPVKIVLAVPCLRGTEVVPLHYLEYLLGRIVFSHYKSLENEVALSTT